MNAAPHEAEASLFERTHDAEKGIAFSAIDCALNGDLAVYASSEITTGRRLNAMLRRHGFTNAAELRQHIGSAELERLIIEPNVERACAFAHDLRERFRGTHPVITPGPFHAPGWSQRQYLDFWEALIRTRTQAVFFNRGWHYSSGCTFEFWVALHHGVPTFAADGAPLPPDDGLRLMRTAATRAARSGFNVAPLRRSIDAVTELIGDRAASG